MVQAAILWGTVLKGFCSKCPGAYIILNTMAGDRMIGASGKNDRRRVNTGITDCIKFLCICVFQRFSNHENHVFLIGSKTEYYVYKPKAHQPFAVPV